MLYIILILIFVVIAPFAIASRSLAPWIPTRIRDLQRVFALVKPKAGEKFFDLGCGNGRVVFYCVANYNIEAIGIELNTTLFFWCMIKKFFLKTDRVKFIRANALDINLQEADIVYVFGMPATNQKMFGEKLDNELKPGTRIISYAFEFWSWHPEVIDKPTKKDLPIYLYIKK